MVQWSEYKRLVARPRQVDDARSRYLKILIWSSGGMVRRVGLASLMLSATILLV
jgi:hypothetical protein